MRAHVRVLPQGKRAAQRFQCLGILAHAKQHPTQAVDDVGVLRGEFKRLFDQLARFGQAQVAIRQRIAPSIVRMRMIGLQLHHAFQITFEYVNAIEFFSDHRLIVKQINGIRRAFERLAEQVIRILVGQRLAQQIGFRLH